MSDLCKEQKCQKESHVQEKGTSTEPNSVIMAETQRGAACSTATIGVKDGRFSVTSPMLSSSCRLLSRPLVDSAKREYAGTGLQLSILWRWESTFCEPS